MNIGVLEARFRFVSRNRKLYVLGVPMCRLSFGRIAHELQGRSFRFHRKEMPRRVPQTEIRLPRWIARMKFRVAARMVSAMSLSYMELPSFEEVAACAKWA